MSALVLLAFLIAAVVAVAYFTKAKVRAFLNGEARKVEVVANKVDPKVFPAPEQTAVPVSPPPPQA